MEAHLKKNIKDLIDQYPPVAKILDEYGIGCVPCSVGTCQLIDVVDIHNLPREDERKMMESIAGSRDKKRWWRQKGKHNLFPSHEKAR
jgi:hypothetical protein